MGMYLNPGNEGFKNIISTKYVDKTMLIEYTNSMINTTNKLICFTKTRRFGKSYAAKMLSAYYCTNVDSHTMFENLKIANGKVTSYEKCISCAFRQWPGNCYLAYGKREKLEKLKVTLGNNLYDAIKTKIELRKIY